MNRSFTHRRLHLETLENRLAPAIAAAEYLLTQDWGSGFQGQIRLVNEQSTTVTGWRLEFDFPAEITSLWDARIVSQVGQHYVLEGASWNRDLPVDGVITFGFVARPLATAPVPDDYLLNGMPLDEDSPDLPPPPDPGTGETEPDVPPPADNVAVRFDTLSDWGTGFTGQITVRNTGTAPLSGWTLAFDFPGRIDSLWDAEIVSQSGGRYVVRSAGWNDTIAPGGTVSFGFVASPGGAVPTSFVLNGTGSGSGEEEEGENGVPNAGQGSSWPAEFFAPYVDATLWPTYDFAATAQQTGLRYFTLAFIVADPQGRPSWGGYSEYAVDGGAFDQQMRGQIAAVRALGGDVMVSFGGAANRELAEVITDVDALVNAYRQVVDAYGLTQVDFDIEGAATADRVSVDRRSEALARLQRELEGEGRTLEVWLTLPVLPTGLTPDGVYVVESALRAGVRLAGVNVMAMDYGDAAAPNPSGRMGDYAIQAATSLHAQLRSLYGPGLTDAQLWDLVGVTPMIGLNDVTTEVFDQQEAAELLAFAEEKGIGRLSLWSLNRDRQHANGAIDYVDLHSSSVEQTPLEFSLLFDHFTG